MIDVLDKFANNFALWKQLSHMLFRLMVFLTITHIRSHFTEIALSRHYSHYLPVPVAARSKGKATLEPEPTKHSKPTFVWVHIADTCGYI